MQLMGTRADHYVARYSGNADVTDISLYGTPWGRPSARTASFHRHLRSDTTYPCGRTVLQRPVESSQHVPLRYSERLADLGIRASTGSVGDFYDNALDKSVNAPLETE